MEKVVVDASALVEVMVGEKPDPALRQRILTSDLAAPEAFTIEVLNVLRKLLRLKKITDQQADRVVYWLTQAPVAHSPHRALVERTWQLRGSIRPYDAAYVALAEQLDAPFVTCDAKLNGSNGHQAKIEIYPLS